MTRLRRLLPGLCLLGLAAWGGGLGWFIIDARRPPAVPAHADGIVALTGGQGRIEQSLQLLAQGYGDRLLISGVDRHATLGDFLRHQPPPCPWRYGPGQHWATAPPPRWAMRMKPPHGCMNTA